MIEKSLLNEGLHTRRWGLKNFPFPQEAGLELVSKELNHLAAILHVYGGWFLWSKEKKNISFQKEKGNIFYTLDHFYSEKSSKSAK